jgi:hypothetical protein
MFGKQCRLASFLLAGQLLFLPVCALQAQDAPAEESDAIGPSELREFQLPGSAPKSDEPVEPAEKAEPSTDAGESGEQAPPAAGPEAAPAEAAPAETLESSVTEAIDALEGNSVESEVTPAAEAGQPQATGTSPSAPVAASAGPAAKPSATSTRVGIAPARQTAPSAASQFNWGYVLAALVIALLAFGAMRFLRRQQHSEEFALMGVEGPAPEHEPVQPVAALASRAASLFQPATRPPRPAEPIRATPQRPAASPFQAVPRPSRAGETIRAATPAGGNVVGIQIRPWLQLEFTPERVAATATETTVHYELVIRNTGNAVAKNVRVEAAMFNADAQQDREIRAFFSRPVSDKTSRVLAIPPRGSARLRNAVTMPKGDMREITIEGRRLFIPIVAINAIYEWAERKSGQTSMSYLVGREIEKRTDKMAAFRLDLGPRVYRSLGTRQSETALLV